ncbi:MAG: hypothetical protein K2X86_03170 [Cytophagaceae bacterium]|nr:hypothetical protein [Cytophagaceae bacterium]
MKKVQEVLSVFQEGVFEELKLIDGDLNFKIECKYLADQIRTEYSHFYGVFKSAKEFFFIPWDDDLMEIRSIDEIKKLKPDILSIDIENNFLKIYSNCENTYSGGNFYIYAESVKIFDEDFQELALEDLVELSDKYWYSNRAES